MSWPSVIVVGAGLMGRWHAHAARKLGANVVGVVDGRGDAARVLARRCGARSHATLADALARSDAPLVHVCTPLPTHEPLAVEALDAGRHVVVEKPLAPDLRATEALLARAAERGRVLVPVHQFPFQRGVQELLARRDELGALVRVDHAVCSAGGEGRAGPERRAILLEILPHSVSLLRALGAGSGGLEQLAPACLTDDDLELAGPLDGGRAGVAISLRGRPTRNELLVVGTTKTVLVDLFHGYAVFEEGRVSRTDKVLRPLRSSSRRMLRAAGNLAGRAARAEPAYPGLRPLLARVYRAVTEGTPPPVSPEEALDAARLMERVARAGAPA